MSPVRSRVRVETDHSYTNKFYGTTLRYVPVDGEAVVSFQRNANVVGLVNAMKAIPLKASKPLDVHDGVGVYKISASQSWDSTLKLLQRHDQVVNVLPVMKDMRGRPHYFIPDEVLVQFAEGVVESDVKPLLKRVGSVVVTKHRAAGFYTLSVPPSQSLFATLRTLSQSDQVAIAEPSEILFNSFHYNPDDPGFVLQYGLRLINAPAAWDFTLGSPNVILAVIDTGIDLDHPDLAENIFPRGNEDWSFGFNTGKLPTDTDGHGTHVAGIAAARDNAVDGIGLAPNCRLMPLKTTGNTGKQKLVDGIDALQYVTDRAKKNTSLRYVVNMSWGAFTESGLFHRAIKKAFEANILLVASAGNDYHDLGVNPQIPAIYDEVICVANTDRSDRKAPESNFGSAVNVCAPGSEIFSTYPDNTTKIRGGTSQAAPLVTGLAGLLWSVNPNLRNSEVRSIIQNTCDNIDAQNPNHIGMLGHGRINAFRAVTTQMLSIHVSPASFDMSRGESATFEISLIRRLGFNLPVTLVIVSQSSGLNASINPTSTTGSNASMTVQAATNCPVGPREIIVRADAGGVVLTATLQLFVRAFALTLSQPAVFLKGDDDDHKFDEVTISIHRSPGFTEPITFSKTGGPAGQGFNATFTTVTTAGNSAVLRLSVGRFAEESSFTLNITGKSASAQDSVQLAVEVFPSAVAAPPGPEQP